jgi:ABC-type nitrate/sulfonate/bicarbonate transport system substrate-binding protein
MISRRSFAKLAGAAALMPRVALAQTKAKMTIATGVDPSFSQFYVAKEAGLFDKNGLDVTINTGPSGSAMVPFLINDQVNAAYGSDFAGVVNHNVDPKIVAVADGSLLVNWEEVVGRNVADLAGLKGKKIGIAKGTGSEIYWNAVVEKYHLNPSDYQIVDIEAPEMVAAIERGDIDGFAVWEPWPTRTILSVKGTKILVGSKGLIQNRNFIYMNRGWIEKNRGTAIAFMRSLVEANDIINGDRPKASAMVSKFLDMPPELTKELMPKLEFDMYWHDATLDAIDASVALLQKQGKMKGPLDYQSYIYADLLKAVRPQAVTLTKVKMG